MTTHDTGQKQHEDDTRQMAMLQIERYNLASLVNLLANIILDGECHSDNERYEAEEAIKKVLPLI